LKKCRLLPLQTDPHQSGAPAHERLRSPRRQNKRQREKLVGALSAQKLLLYALLLRWYVTRTIDYQTTKFFTWFVEQVNEVRRTGDADKSNVMLAEVFKLLGNST